MRLSAKLGLAFAGIAALAGGWTLTAHARNNSETLKGYVTDTWCGVNRDTKAPTVECTNFCVKSKAAKYAFYNLADKKVYILNPQEMAGKYAGQLVNVTGTVGTESQKFKTMRGDGQGLTITASAIAKAN